MIKLVLSLLAIALLACAPAVPIQDKRENPTKAEHRGNGTTIGKQLAFSRDKGNCLACHVIEDGESPGNIGPELKALPTRFSSKRQLREQIWDATRFNPETSMPPFGKNKILSEEEIGRVVDYLWGIK